MRPEDSLLYHRYFSFPMCLPQKCTTEHDVCPSKHFGHGMTADSRGTLFTAKDFKKNSICISYVTRSVLRVELGPETAGEPFVKVFNFVIAMPFFLSYDHGLQFIHV